MSKKTLVILTSIGWGLLIVGFILFLSGFLNTISAQSQCAPYCKLTPAGLLAQVLPGYLFLFAAGILHLIAQIGALITQAKRQQWGWFVCNLLLGYLCTTVYLIVVPEVRQSLRQRSDQGARRTIHREQPPKKPVHETESAAKTPAHSIQSPVSSSKQAAQSRRNASQRKTTVSQKAVLAKIEQKRKASQ